MRASLLLAAIFFLGLGSCEDKRLQSYVANVPLYMSYEELRSSFEIREVEAMLQPGKIYYYSNYLFINEYQKGIHVVDLSDASHPVKKAFIEVPGNVDMAIRNDILYAESYVDLLLIDISDPENPVEIKRIEDLFEYVIPPYDYDYPLDEIDEEKGVITGYEIKKITREIHHQPYPWPIYYDYRLESSFASPSSAVPGAGGNTYGLGGSMARFITHDHYLYTLESDYKLKSYDLSDTEQVVEKHEQYLWGQVETLFIAGEYMYVGTANGMHILSLAQPSAPNLLSTYQHITACDPVVVEGDRAYITLRAGNLCGGNQNLLDIVDISDKYEPKRKYSFGMTEPYGLGIDEGVLFICQGDHGLNIFDARFESSISSHELAAFPNIHAYDVIPLGDILLTIGDDGFYLYDYSNLQDITLVGSIAIDSAGD